ncbi:MAG: helix-turn-helix domain-containing protein [Pseudomonadota bacterium]
MTEKTVKSVRRVFEVLELFEREQRPLAAKEVARRLDYPLTSTHALLKSMQELGYAEYNASDWTYLPSPRLPRLLRWVEDFLQREPLLLEFMDALNRATRETVNVSRRIDTQVRIIHGFESRHLVGISVKHGTLMPVGQSLTGITALAALDETARRDCLAQIRARDPAQAQQLDEALIHSVLEELAEHGTTCRCDLFVEGIGAVCVPVRSVSGDSLVVGVVGPSERITEHQSAHRDAIAELAAEFRVQTPFALV